MTTPLGKNTAWADKLLLTITWDIVEIVCFALRAAILGECQIYLSGGGTATSLNPDSRPLGTYETKMAVGPVGARSWRSYEKIGDSEQSTWASEISDGFDPLFSTFFYQQAFNSRWREKQVCYSFFYGFLPSCFFALTKKSLLAHEVRLSWRQQQ